MAMLRKLGWWAVGVVLELLGVWISLTAVALLSTGVSFTGDHPAAIVVAVIVGIAVTAMALGAPGYLAARLGGGGELMGLAVGVFVAGVLIGVAAMVLSAAAPELLSEDGAFQRAVFVVEAVELDPTAHNRRMVGAA